MPRAAFSISDPGSTSIVSSTRVRRGASSWKVTTPVCVMPCETRHLMRSSGRWVSILAENSLVLPQIFVAKLTVQSSSCVTRVTRCMKFGQSSNWVHWL
jgi:hypothetical protein